MLLKGNRFLDTKDIKGKAMMQLLAVPKYLCPNCFIQWKDHWNKCAGTALKGLISVTP